MYQEKIRDMEIKRNHPLAVGERVYDNETALVGHITAINEDGTINIEMLDFDEQENRKMFDEEFTEDETAWVCDNPDALYQFAPGLVARDGNAVCYEHMPTEDGYPYFSPYLYENLFSVEVFTFGEFNHRDDPAAQAAYAIVCKMIDCGLVESEPEGIDWEGEIAKIIREKFGIE